MPLLKSAPGLRPVAIFDEIRRRHPAEIGVGVRRTLERRIGSWRALNGAEQDVIFLQALTAIPSAQAPYRVAVSRRASTCGLIRGVADGKTLITLK